MTFLNIFKHLLPNARAWTITQTKNLRDFFSGLTAIGDDAKTFIDQIWQDISPKTTRELNQWENQFALTQTGLTDQDRRDRLTAVWKAIGGQSSRYIQDTLQNCGFSVYVHEWWTPGTEPPIGVNQAAAPRNPLLYLSDSMNATVECNEALAQCGEAFPEAGNTTTPLGYPLVNKIENSPNYQITNDPLQWPYFLYIGGQTFGTLAQVPPQRRNEFETLCLKICPLQNWLGMLVEYQ